MEWTAQLRAAFGDDAPLFVPNTLEDALRPSAEPRIVSTTRTPHRIVAANAAVCRLTGFAESELVDTRLGWLEE